ncbi:MAG: phospholipase D-like domain-containing protein [Verrucomicrobia bacterium]|nr:phospholipase D-like domain-containing protein [Verrucomicrobiota bacterium]
MAPSNELNSRKATFRWLNSGDAFFEAAVSAIADSRSSVLLETYIFTECALGERVRAALIEALRRGVEVKVLLDGWGSLFLQTSFWNPFCAAGGSFRWFNPINLKRYVFRNHRKLLVCDESLALVGGFNMASEWEGDGITRGWRDIGLEVRGPIARDLVTSFETMFSIADFRHKRFTRLRRALLRKSVPIESGEILLSSPGRGQNHFSDSIP